MTRAIVQSKNFAFIPWRPKKSTKQFLLIWVPVPKIPRWSEKVCFGCSPHSLWSQMRKAEEPWKICRVILESSQFIVRGWLSSFSFEQTNIKICFFTSMEMIFLLHFFGKVRERDSSQFSVSPSWMKRTFHCCPFLFVRSGWENFPLSGQRVLFSHFILCVHKRLS